MPISVKPITFHKTVAMKYNENGLRGSRREFIKKTASGAATLLIAPRILGRGSNWKGANERIQIGHIGLGSRGTSEMKNYFLPLEGSRSLAACDVYRERREGAAELVNSYYREKGYAAPKCATYLDYEEILMRDDIDAVHITTPDHWHVLGAINAARAGKHVMLAKPLGLSYPNYLILKTALEENDVRFHYATQQRSMKHMQLGIDMIREGKIGTIERVDVWAPGKNPVTSPVCIPEPVPDGFDFDRWTGPAPLNTYCRRRVTNNSSWFQYDYSIGFLAGWGAHPLDVLVWGIRDQIDGAYTCKGTGTFWNEGGIYDNIWSWDVLCRYRNGLEVHFMSMDRAESAMLDHRTVKDSNGTTFYGSKGWISLSRGSAESDIRSLNRMLNDFPKNDSGRIRSEENTFGQMFIDVVHGRIPETCPLDEAIISDTISHMGDIAIRVQREVTWDPVRGSVPDDPEAAALYVRTMREPYTP
jgi:predicted dehydrogenase